MTLQELRNYIKSRYATDASDVEIDDHINEVYRDISRIFTPDTTEEYSDGFCYGKRAACLRASQEYPFY